MGDHNLMSSYFVILDDVDDPTMRPLEMRDTVVALCVSCCFLPKRFIYPHYTCHKFVHNDLITEWRRRLRPAPPSHNVGWAPRRNSPAHYMIKNVENPRARISEVPTRYLKDENGRTSHSIALAKMINRNNPTIVLDKHRRRPRLKRGSIFNCRYVYRAINHYREEREHHFDSWDEVWEHIMKHLHAGHEVDDDIIRLIEYKQFNK